jgi:hypothetical protein
MQIDYEKWHEGIGYDLDALAEIPEHERAGIEATLVAHATRDWRDVQALAALGTPTAREALRHAFRDGDAGIRMAVLREASELIPEDAKTAALVDALKHADFAGGLSPALDQVETFHPPEVVDALIRGVLERPREAAVNFAAMLFYVRGEAVEPFDWEQRPFFLRFATDDRQEREAAFRELCSRIGVDPEPYLASSGR